MAPNYASVSYSILQTDRHRDWRQIQHHVYLWPIPNLEKLNPSECDELHNIFFKRSISSLFLNLPSPMDIKCNFRRNMIIADCCFFFVFVINRKFNLQNVISGIILIQLLNFFTSPLAFIVGTKPPRTLSSSFYPVLFLSIFGSATLEPFWLFNSLNMK